MEDSLKLYTEEEMIEEVCTVIESMGGVVDLVDKEKHLFKVTIDPGLEDQAADIIQDIIERYNHKRGEVMRKNPLLRALSLRKEIYGDDAV